MRMWLGVDPSEMCRKHLLGEHVELHMLAGSIEKGKSIQGFLDKGLVDPWEMFERHSKIWHEMVLRGYEHNSHLDGPRCVKLAQGYKSLFDPENLSWYLLLLERNRTELAARCPECAARMGQNLNAEVENETV